jgi:hypothetical protein
MNARWPNLVVLVSLAALPTLLPAQRGGPGGSRDLVACRAKNRNSLQKVQANYASVRVPKTDQDRYTSLLTPIQNVGPTLADCDANTPKIVELSTAVDGIVARAKANPVYMVGDKALGGVVVNVDTAGKHGLVSAVEDLPAMGGMIFVAAQQGCQNLRTGGFSDWYVPSSAELGHVWKQRALVGNFKALGYGYYWTSTRMFQQDNKVYWVRWSDQFSGWTDTEDRGPSRGLFNARCVRKF